MGQVASQRRLLEDGSSTGDDDGIADDENLLRTRFALNGSTCWRLQCASPRLRNKRNFCLDAIRSHHGNARYVSSQLMNDRSFVLQAIGIHGWGRCMQGRPYRGPERCPTRRHWSTLTFQTTLSGPKNWFLLLLYLPLFTL